MILERIMKPDKMATEAETQELRKKLEKLLKQIGELLEECEKEKEKEKELKDCSFLTEMGDCKLTNDTCYYIVIGSQSVFSKSKYWHGCPIYNLFIRRRR